MSYDYRGKKIVAVLASNLETGVALNVLGHLAISIGAHSALDIIGRSPLIDGSGMRHTGIARYPVIVTKVRSGKLRKLIDEARSNSEILLADYPREMLDTGHDDELAEALAKRPEENLEYLGAILYGPHKAVSDLTARFTLWT